MSSKKQSLLSTPEIVFLRFLNSFPIAPHVCVMLPSIGIYDVSSTKENSEHHNGSLWALSGICRMETARTAFRISFFSWCRFIQERIKVSWELGLVRVLCAPREERTKNWKSKPQKPIAEGPRRTMVQGGQWMGNYCGAYVWWIALEHHHRRVSIGTGNVNWQSVLAINSNFRQSA